MKIRNIITFILIFIITLTVFFAACSDTNNTAAADTMLDALTNADSGNTREPLDLPQEKYDGYALRILSVNSTQMGNSSSVGAHYWSDFGYNPERKGEPINDAVFLRNSVIEERYNIKIVLTEAADVAPVIKKFTAAGDDEYDIVCPVMNNSFSLAQTNCLYDLYKVPHLDMTKSWWDNAMYEQLSLGGKIYIASGDISMEDEEYNSCIIFNKSLIENYSLTDPYQYIKEDKWTLENFYTLGTGITSDLNGDGNLDYNDIYGFGNDYTGAQFWYFYSGENIAVLNNGEPEIVLYGTRQASVMDRLIEIFNDKQFMIWVSEMKGVENGWTEVNNMLIDNRLLFRLANIYNIKQFRDMIDDFGILPGPKFDESQENYYHLISTHASLGISVPITQTDPERVGLLLEALAYESAEVAKAHYDVTLTGKFARDEESLVSLEIIFNSKVYDIGKVFGWGSLGDVIDNAVKQGGNFASLYEKSITRAQTALDESYALFRG
ncbi:MAG: hypothetical protein ACYCWE_15955 [Eubacteriales bacterium]